MAYRAIYDYLYIYIYMWGVFPLSATSDQTTFVGKTVQMGFVAQSREALQGRNSVYEEISGDNPFVDVSGDRIHTRAYMASFNLRGPMQEKKVSSLSGGERNRVHLAKMLLGGHNVILLDEPTNDLDVDTLRYSDDTVPIISIDHSIEFIYLIITLSNLSI
jgi:ATPase subunit of ABC transporter with duplicated ATPase domains